MIQRDEKLSGVHRDLADVIRKASLYLEFDLLVIEGIRSIEKQKQLFAKGASKTMNSRHLTGHAVDVAPIIDGEVRWDWPLYHVIAEAIKKAAKELDILVEWGGDWRTFKDGPHFQLPWKAYP